MTKRIGQPIYAGKADQGNVRGLEFYGSTKEKKEEKGKVIEGKVTLRFLEIKNFSLLDDIGGRFVMSPAEAFALSLGMKDVEGKGGKYSTLPHKYSNKEDGRAIDIMTTVTVEKWGDEKKGGFAMVFVRGKNTVNVPMNRGDFLFVARMLEVLAIDQCWTDYEKSA